jgi:hypothetical protein
MEQLACKYKGDPPRLRIKLRSVDWRSTQTGIHFFCCGWVELACFRRPSPSALTLLWQSIWYIHYRKKGICSLTFLCFSGSMFITENTFLHLKNLCTSARSRNIRWVLMFLDQIRSLRNIMTYIHWPDQKAEEQKVGPYIPRPGQILKECNDLCSSTRLESWEI